MQNSIQLNFFRQQFLNINKTLIDLEYMIEFSVEEIDNFTGYSGVEGIYQIKGVSFI